MTHTKGPWEFRVAPNGDCGIHADGTGVFAEAFADIRLARENAREEAKSNARLISAAPDLLEALQLVVDEIDGTFPFESLAAARAAISKAKGAA